MKTDIAIIGGGLSGLSLAHELVPAGRDVRVFEARGRWGGRIVSLPEAATFRHDLGPSWVWPDFQPRLVDFIRRHKLDVYPQWNSGKSLYQTSATQPAQAYLDEGTYAPARRIDGGMYRLIEAVLPALPAQSGMLNCRLRRVVEQGTHVSLAFEGAVDAGAGRAFTVEARQVVVTVPPRLLANTIAFSPALAPSLQALMRTTPTWMAGHAKAVVCYPRAFWRDAGLSGNAMAAYPGAALGQIFDASAPDGSQAALSGFFALPASVRRTHRDALESLIVAQCVDLFGAQAAQPQEIHIMDWADETATADAADANPPPGHPDYGHALLQTAYWNDKLYFSGTETAPAFGGYLEGALEAAERVAKLLLA